MQFTPDLLGDLRLEMANGLQVRGGVFLQTCAPTSDKGCGTFDDGRIGAVANSDGRGKTILIGTFPEYGYATSPDEETKHFFA